MLVIAINQENQLLLIRGGENNVEFSPPIVIWGGEDHVALSLLQYPSKCFRQLFKQASNNLCASFRNSYFELNANNCYACQLN